ncbi:EAL domain-containing protein [Actinotalea sp. C106]|uniref:EAL domain-containing protein n=1 Tax=Actinotalea sp. C106 TaxID=2908644 RepID=UPI0020290427|nr:EAL domain-containing protein [Actinotalea sp. C106]
MGATSTSPDHSLAAPAALHDNPVDRLVARAARISPVVSVTSLALMLAAIWVAVYVSGGTQRALPHLFYVPIILGALAFGWRGSFLTAIAASVLCGPVMPLDSVTGEAQQVVSWVTRSVMFVVIGVVIAAVLSARQHLLEQQLEREVRTAIARSTNGARHVDHEVASRVADVLERRAFHPVYQPVFSLRTGRLLGVEALTRFDAEPARTPDVWFEAAASVGLGPDLEIAAIEAALGPEGLGGAQIDVSVNASPSTLADPRLLELVRARPDRSLTIEITEHAAIEDYHVLKANLAPLRAAGVRVAVDDAGAGFSSLQHIVQLAPDVIKLDMSLTQGVDTSPLRRALAGALIDFAERTGAQLVVEGIETDTDLAAWSALGAHAVQGYLVGRPGALPAPPSSPRIASMLALR